MNVSSAGSASSAAVEAKETAAQTQAEAAKGDQQAVLKLAQAKAANTPKESPFTAKGRLDTTA